MNKNWQFIENTIPHLCGHSNPIKPTLIKIAGCTYAINWNWGAPRTNSPVCIRRRGVAEESHHHQKKRLFSLSPDFELVSSYVQINNSTRDSQAFYLASGTRYKYIKLLGCILWTMNTTMKSFFCLRCTMVHCVGSDPLPFLVTPSKRQISISNSTMRIRNFLF